ncbi:MAG: ABC transporter permease [Phycisphaerae bacterium]|nr:ABC transporter permease [Phycisphaerae bacterium]
MMRKSLKLACREYKATVKSKGFIIGLILAPIFMGGSLIAFALLKDRVDTRDKNVVIVDRSGVIAPVLLTAAQTRNAEELHDTKGKKIKPAYVFTITAPEAEDPGAQRFELSERVRQGAIHAFVEIGEHVVHPGENPDTSRITYHAKNAAMDEVRSWMGWPINNELRRLRVTEAGIDESKVRDLFHWANVEGMGLVSRDVQTGRIRSAKRSSEIEALIIPIITMMLMFMMVMMNVPGMLHSVMEEKTQRIAEVLLGSIKPFDFMMGKLFSGVAVALTISAVYLSGIVFVVHRMAYEQYIPFHVLPWFLVFMFLAVVMMGAGAMALGATCNEAKDAQSLTLPTIMPAMICMFVYIPVAKEPLSSFATVMSLIPPFTPFLMVLRQTTPEAIPPWQPVVGLIGVVAFTLLVVWFAGRIFRVAILMQGMPPKLSNIVRWALRG